jgi:hypothetical protein
MVNILSAGVAARAEGGSLDRQFVGEEDFLRPPAGMTR